MNPRTIHALMSAFPKVEAHLLSWINLLERDGSLRAEALSQLIGTHIPADVLLVWVSRQCGAFLPRGEAIAFISQHIGQGEIRIADRQFQGFVVVARNGVACGWRAAGAGSDEA